MKTKRILFVVSALLLAILIAACDSNGNSSKDTESKTDISTESTTVTAIDTLDKDTVTDEQTSGMTDAVSKSVDTEAPIETATQSEKFDYTDVDKYCDLLQNGASLMSATVDFYKSMADIMNVSDEDDIESSFTYYLSTTTKGENGTTYLLIPSVLHNYYDNYEKASPDPDILPLMQECILSYTQLHEIVYKPSGTYSDFLQQYNDAYDKFVFDYDELVAYLYAVGVYTE